MGIISPKPPAPNISRKRTDIPLVQTVGNAAVGSMIRIPVILRIQIATKIPTFHSMCQLRVKHMLYP
jgi:hypothetical protein